MLNRLKQMKLHYEQLAEKIASPEVMADMNAWRELVKEHSTLEPIITAYDEYLETERGIADCRAMLDSEETEQEMRTLAEEELAELSHKAAQQQENLKILLLPKDKNDERNVIMEIRAGTGGDEAALFGAVLMRMYQRYAERHNFKYELIDIAETEMGGIKEATFSLNGRGAYSRMKYESGVHRVQRVPETETQGRIHTSAATVAVLPEAEDIDVEINPGDLRIDTYRSGGAGGQNVNKVSSAIRITHLPTGIVVQCQNERSQLQNKEMAMRILKGKLMELAEQERMAQMNEIKGEMKRIEWGSQIRSYVFQPYTLVKDHRTGEENGNIQAVMDGDIENFINAYLAKS